MFASAFIEAFPLAADLATRSEILMDVSKMPAPDDDAVDRRARFAARANAILALIECSAEVRPSCAPSSSWARNSRDVKAST